MLLESSVKASSSSKEKTFLSPDPSANNEVKKGLEVTTETESTSASQEHERNGGKHQPNFGKPQLVVKLATKKMTCKNLSRETTLRRGRSRSYEKASTFSHEEENGDVDDEVLGKPDTDAERKEKQHGRTSRSKIVWNLTLVKQRGTNSEKNLGRRSRRGFNAESCKTHEKVTREELVIDQDASVSTKPVGQQKTVMAASVEEDDQENAVSPDRCEGSSPHSPKLSPRSLKRRKSIFGYRRKPEQEELKVKKARSPVENRLPRKRRRLVCYTYEAVESPANQESVNQEPPAQVVSQQGLSDSAISGRPSRVIRVPKRFMDDDDEGMSGLLGKKLLQMDNQEDETYSDAEEANLSQTPKSGIRQKSTNKRTVCDDDENLFGKSLDWKPSGLPSGPRKKVGRPAYDDATPFKIYERLKMLTASLAQRKEQRLASSRSLGENIECASRDVTDSRELRKWGNTDIKIGDLNCPGVVHKVAIHADDQVISQATLPSVETLETKADGKERDHLPALQIMFLDFTSLFFS